MQYLSCFDANFALHLVGNGLARSVMLVLNLILNAEKTAQVFKFELSFFCRLSCCVSDKFVFA